ncbi:hypothetical protein [Aquincola tertiaricarbonis]|uniref:hypothetical protein n=1 Tax=Aquincola tertiaricarbonis TaxID=391953 RepID=UPI000614C6DA|nr:hypothetical protein [Aquincola tertiaricarbonis]
MKPAGPPDQACAVIVGVERCGVFPDDPLLGPVRDALAWADWLLARGVRPERIVLFLSAKPASQPLVDAWQQRMTATVPPDRQPRLLLQPTEAAFQTLVNTELPQLAATLHDATLLLVWSGHGVIDQRDNERSRRLFHADATDLEPRNLEPLSLMKALRTRPYAGFAQQLLVVDACANYVMTTARDRRLSRPSDFNAVTAEPRIQQRVLLATAPGQVAQSQAGLPARESVALFSSRLLQALGDPPAGSWPDFHQAFRTVQQAFAAADEQQTPVDWSYGQPDDALPDSGLQLLPEVRATQLLRIVQALPAQMLAPTFHAALPPAQPTPAHQAAADQGAVAMAWLLGQMPQAAGLPDALLRWALQLRCRLPVPTDHPELLLWIKRQGQQDAAQAYLAQAQAAQQAAAAGATLCFVLVAQAPGAAAGTTVLHGWLFAGQPVQVLALGGTSGEGAEPLAVQADGSGRAEALKALLDEATTAAQSLGIELPDFIIEVALPLERIDDDVEAHGFGPRGRERAIGSRYPVVRRLADRLAALGHRRRGTEIVQWQKAAMKLGERFSAHGLRIVWMEPQGIRDGLLASRLDAVPQGCCVGLSLAVPGRTLDEASKYTLYDDGLPFACWSDAAWSEADTACLEADLGACSGPQALLKLFALRQADAAQRKHPGSRLRLLWDDPARNPYAPQLKAAER